MSTATGPTVSVVMTTYNGEAYIRETIESIINQTFTDWELVIVDDCSSDRSHEIALSYSDARIKTYRNDRNEGISRSRNRAVALATGRYVAATDQDDLSMPERLEKQVLAHVRSPNLVLVASAAKELRGNRTRLVYRGETRSKVLAWRLFTQCSIVHSSICYRRNTALKYDIHYEDNYRFAEDFVLFHRFSTVGDLQILPEALVVYREHETNASSANSDEMNNNGARFVSEAFSDELGVVATERGFEDLWRLFSLGEPAGSEERLLDAGQLYVRGLKIFLLTRNLSPGESEEVSKYAAEQWWQVVSVFCRVNRRFDALTLFSSIELLGSRNPKFVEYVKQQIASSLSYLS